MNRLTGPTLSQRSSGVEDRRHREPDGGQDDHRSGDTADRLTGDREAPCAGSSTRPRSSRADPPREDRRRQRDRCSCRRGRPRSGGQILAAASKPIASAARSNRSPRPACSAAAGQPCQSAAGAPGRPSRRATFPCSWSGVGPEATTVTEASQRALAARPPRLSPPAVVKLRRERDQVGQLADRLQVAERGQPLEAERVEVIARQQGQIGVGAHHDARLPVVEQVALANRLDQQAYSPGAPPRAGRPRPAGRAPARPPRDADLRRDHRLLGPQLRCKRGSAASGELIDGRDYPPSVAGRWSVGGREPGAAGGVKAGDDDRQVALPAHRVVEGTAARWPAPGRT